jgi:hypothetical protein
MRPLQPRNTVREDGARPDLPLRRLIQDRPSRINNERTRAFTAKVRPHMGAMVPTSVQAGAYSSVLHYLKVVQEVGV